MILGESKQRSSLIPYSNRDILENIERGRIPDALADWLDLDKLIFRAGTVDLAIVERNEAGSVLSLRVIPLEPASTHLAQGSNLVKDTI